MPAVAFHRLGGNVLIKLANKPNVPDRPATIRIWLDETDEESRFRNVRVGVRILSQLMRISPICRRLKPLSLSLATIGDNQSSVGCLEKNVSHEARAIEMLKRVDGGRKVPIGIRIPVNAADRITLSFCTEAVLNALAL